MIFREKSVIVTKRRDNPPRKVMSATLSSLLWGSSFPFIERKERMQLVMNSREDRMVISSMIDLSLVFNKRNEVSMIRQIPSRLDDVFRICGVLSFLVFMAASLIG